MSRGLQKTLLRGFADLQIYLIYLLAKPVFDQSFVLTAGNVAITYQRLRTYWCSNDDAIPFPRNTLLAGLFYSL